jgi:hypothetical protein
MAEIRKCLEKRVATEFRVQIATSSLGTTFDAFRNKSEACASCTRGMLAQVGIDVMEYPT